MHRVLFAVVLVASSLISFPAAAGQPQGPASQWTLQGRVLDPMRAPIAGARITAVPETPGTPVLDHYQRTRQLYLAIGARALRGDHQRQRFSRFNRRGDRRLRRHRVA